MSRASPHFSPRALREDPRRWFGCFWVFLGRATAPFLPPGQLASVRKAPREKRRDSQVMGNDAWVIRTGSSLRPSLLMHYRVISERNPSLCGQSNKINSSCEAGRKQCSYAWWMCIQQSLGSGDHAGIRRNYWIRRREVPAANKCRGVGLTIKAGLLFKKILKAFFPVYLKYTSNKPPCSVSDVYVFSSTLKLWGRWS